MYNHYSKHQFKVTPCQYLSIVVEIFRNAEGIDLVVNPAPANNQREILVNLQLQANSLQRTGVETRMKSMTFQEVGQNACQ